MGKPILERMKRATWWLDQGLHCLLGFGVSSPSMAALAYGAGWHPALAGFIGSLVGIVVVFIRELVQNWGDEPEDGSVEDTSFDALFGMLGVALALLVTLGA